jgi:hypothetical protein
MRCEMSEACEEVIAIGVVAEYDSALHSSGEDVVQITGRVQARGTGHWRGRYGA